MCFFAYFEHLFYVLDFGTGYEFGVVGVGGEGFIAGAEFPSWFVSLIPVFVHGTGADYTG